jgi:hypothetical protein
MKDQISQDIGYLGLGGKALLDSVFKCQKCSSRLLMFGCDNEQCENSQTNNLKNDKTK